MFMVSTGERFATLREANTFAIVHATPNSGVTVTMPQGGIMSLWDFRVWSTLAVRRLDGGARS